MINKISKFYIYVCCNIFGNILLFNYMFVKNIL